jgi:hypothetical protein
MKHWLFAAALALAFPTGRAWSQDARRDPARLDAVRALYGSAAAYPEAIARLEALVAGDPGWSEARRDLARVLAWSRRYPESLAHYERLVSAAPDDLGLRVERAETASWASDYALARRELAGVLEREPDHPGALLALARVERWSGRLVLADRLYRQRLARESTPELRAEWRELRAGHGPQVGASARLFTDKGDFTRYDVSAEAALFPTLASRLALRAGSVKVSAPLILSGGGETRESDRALELALVHEGRLGDALRTRAELGTRDWRRAEGRPFARLGAALEGDAWSAGLDLEHTDHIDRSDSLAVLREGLRQSGAAAHLSSALGPRWSLWSSLHWLRVTDGNQRGAADLALTWTPREDVDLGLSLAASALGYAETSPFYYTPESDMAATAGLHAGLPLPGSLALRAGARAGLGRVHERDRVASGAVGGADAELAWERGGWSVLLRGEYGFSARADGWRWAAALLRVERRF